MDKLTEIKHTLSWEGDGRFEAEITNGQISKLFFAEIGKGEKDCGKFLDSTSYKFLTQTRDNLTQMLDFINEENKRLGYSYPTDKSIQENASTD